MKLIPNFNNYSIDTNGNIWSSHSNKLKAPCTICNGYQTVQLWKKGKAYMKLIHRLVLETFIGPCPPGMEACHNNGNPKDNKLENLRWDAPKNNHQDIIKQGTHSCLLKGEASGGSKLKWSAIKTICLKYNSGNFAQKELAEFYKVNQSTISRIINNKTWVI